MNEVTKKRTIKFFKYVITLVLVVLLIVNVDWSEVWQHMQEISLWQIGLYLLFLLSGMVISCWKWHMLAKFKGISGSFYDFFKLYMAGIFINNFMPSTIGGDTFKSYQIGKPEKRYSEAASTVIVDRVTGFFGLIILALVIGLINFDAVVARKTLIITQLVLLGITVFSLLLFFTRKNGLWKKIFGFLPDKVFEFLKILVSFRGGGVFTKSMLLSFLFAFVGLACANYVLFFAVGIKIAILDYLTIIFVMSLIAALPISINNIGVKEWAYITFFGLFGVSASALVTVAILSRFMQLMVSIFALPVYLRAKRD